MQLIKQLRARILPGLRLLGRGIAYGVLAGTLIALLWPSALALGSMLLAEIRRTPLPQNKWVNAIIAPQRLIGIVLVALVTVAFIRRKSLAYLLRRCYSWSL